MNKYRTNHTAIVTLYIKAHANTIKTEEEFFEDVFDIWFPRHIDDFLGGTATINDGIINITAMFEANVTEHRSMGDYYSPDESEFEGAEISHRIPQESLISIIQDFEL
jgi:hypothetical protein